MLASEDQPAVMAKKISAATEHGVGMFLFDWYWYASPTKGGVPDLQVRALSSPISPISPFSPLPAPLAPLHSPPKMRGQCRLPTAPPSAAGRWRRALPGRRAERRLPQGPQPRDDEVCAHVGQSGLGVFTAHTRTLTARSPHAHRTTAARSLQRMHERVRSHRMLAAATELPAENQILNRERCSARSTSTPPSLGGTQPAMHTASRRRDCHSAAPPSPFRRCLNMDGERASGK